MKFFVRKILIFSFCIVLADILLCIVIDPFNVFHPFNIRDNGVEANKNYIKMKYVLANPEKYDAFLFGSSRVGNIHVENIPGERCYNMSYSCGVPTDHLENIKTLIAHNIIPKHIYIGLDFESYMNLLDFHDDDLLRSTYEYSINHPVLFWKKYFNPAVVGQSLATTSLPYLFQSHPLAERYQEIFYSYGWNYDYGFSTNVEFNNSDWQIRAYRDRMIDELNDELINNFSDFGNMDLSLDAISDIVKICDENGIKLTVFTNPVYYDFFVNAVSQHYLVYLQRLAEITPYYNFSGFNDITTDEANYHDKSHYNAETGDLITNCICNNSVPNYLLEQGFGFYVTQDNCKGLIDLLTTRDYE